MSASICWRKVNPSPDHIRVMAPSKFMEQMARASMELPCAVGLEQKPVLIGLAAGWGREDEHNPYLHILQLVDQHGEIELWPEY